MASKKSNKGKRVYAQNHLAIIIRGKSREFLSAEREYWKQRDSLRKSMEETVGYKMRRRQGNTDDRYAPAEFSARPR